jgi:hypothetical protein
VKALLRHRCDLERAALVDDAGYLKKQWHIQQGNVRCLFQERKGSFIKELQGEALEYDGTLYLPRNLDVRPQRADDTQDRVKLIKPPSFYNVYLLILFVMDSSGRADKQGCLTAVVKRVAPETPPD